MDKSAAGSFIFAKASGNLGKSFVGSRSQILFEQKNLGELWTLLFKSPVPVIPEVLLAEKIETEAFSRFFNKYVSFVNAYDKPNPILTDLLCIYEVSNLKVIAAALANGETKAPNLMDLGTFAKCNFKVWPNLAEITAGTPYSWLNKTPSVHDLQHIDYKLDLFVVQHLWNSVQKTSGENKEIFEKIFFNVYVIKNIVWALRLRIYYKMEDEEIIKRLIYVTNGPSMEDPVAAPAIKVLEMPLNDAEVWEKWTYKEYVNPYVSGENWQIDPAWIEKKAAVKVNKIAMNAFHQYPMTDCSLVGWYKIKEYELSCIRMAVESLRLNINTEEAMQAAGLLAEGGLSG